MTAPVTDARDPSLPRYRAALKARVAGLADELAAATARADRLEQELARLRDRVEGSGPRFAALYAGFTDRFRGTVEDVTAKLTGYLDDVSRLVTAGPVAREVRVVDVGCGRGEWLALLRDSSVRAVGVDANPDFVAAGRARGLDMVHADGIAYLQGREPGSLDLVTSFHVIEHLDVDTLLGLFAAALAALRPGGGLLVETPNPTNLAMGACNFYLDPTHRSPLPPALTEYLMTVSGFRDVEVRPLHPADSPLDPAAGETTAVEQLVVRALRGPQDYAVLGYKPGGPAPAGS